MSEVVQPCDTALVIDGVVKSVWLAREASTLPPPEEGFLVEFPANTAFAGMLWDGEALTLPPPPEPSLAELIARVNATRDARIDGTFEHQGHRYQCGPLDRENIQALARKAREAQAAGAEPGDLRWFELVGGGDLLPDQDFAWIAADNSLVPMDAWGPPALEDRWLIFKMAQTLYGRALKDALAAAPEGDRAAIYAAAVWPD